MLFNSYIFIFLFLPLSLLGYYLLNNIQKYQIAKLFLIAMSFWFYAYFNVSYLLIIISSILINYTLSNLMLKKKRIILLLLGLIFNLGMLFYFKYFDFFIANINALFSKDFNLKNILLPLGISFFTFQQLSYVIDSYKQKVPKYNLIDYALFVTFFPQLIAGPIVLHSEILPQFEDHNNKKFNSISFSKGLYAFSLGIAKKVLLADTFGLYVNYGFNNIPELYFLDTIFVFLSYTLQIYFDFSGYCDMATGISLLFNINIPMNFNSPYKSLSISEFWKRWHITLTRFFTQYLYIPLGGNRKGELFTYINIFIVFLVSGLWHGANWTFIIWGILHGVAIIIMRFSQFEFRSEATIVTRFFNLRIDKLFSWIATFSFLNITWSLFRAESITQWISIMKTLSKVQLDINKNLVTSTNSIPEFNILSNMQTETFFMLFIGTILGVTLLKNTNEKLDNFQAKFSNALLSAILLVWSILSLSGISEFLYFNF